MSSTYGKENEFSKGFNYALLMEAALESEAGALGNASTLKEFKMDGNEARDEEAALESDAGALGNASTLTEFKDTIRQLLHSYVCVSLSSLPVLYDQRFKSKLLPEHFGITTGEFKLTRLMRRIPDVVAVVPAMDPFKGTMLIPLPNGADVVHPPLPPDLCEALKMSGAEIGSDCGPDEDPYWVKYQEGRAKQMLNDVVRQVCFVFILANRKSKQPFVTAASAARRVRATGTRFSAGLARSKFRRKVWLLLLRLGCPTLGSLTAPYKSCSSLRQVRVALPEEDEHFVWMQADRVSSVILQHVGSAVPT